MNPDNAMLYLDFVRERHRIWEQRQAGLPGPWTEDPILASRKFTNVYRALDYGSQYLLSILQEQLTPRETLMRCFLYRHTGRVEPWQFFELLHGRFPTLDDLPLALETWKDYRGGAQANPVFTSAYLVFPQSQTPGTDKLDSIIDLTARLFTPGSSQDVMPAFLDARTQRERFASMQRNKGVGDFMAMQILTDYGYTRAADLENDFVVAGPGAVKGAALVFPGKPATHAIEWARDNVTGVEVHGRPPSLMDLQNTFCEFFKYARYIDRPPASKPYAPAHPGPQEPPILPTNWKV